MLASTKLAVSPSFALSDVVCRACRSTWSDVESADAYGLVLARRGCFYRRGNGVDTLVDASTAYVLVPGDEQQILHPSDEGDHCTVLRLDEDAFRALTRDELRPGAAFVVDAVADLEHRQLVAGARAGFDELEFDERAWLLAANLLASRADLDLASRPLRAACVRRRIVEVVREALSTKVSPSLRDLAADAGVSPHHLSRIFRAHTGSTLTDYRNRLRVRRALDRMAAGERSLARLAADLGFADQPHLTRTMKRVLGTTPAAVRETLAAA